MPVHHATLLPLFIVMFNSMFSLQYLGFGSRSEVIRFSCFIVLNHVLPRFFHSFSFFPSYALCPYPSKRFKTQTCTMQDAPHVNRLSVESVEFCQFFPKKHTKRIPELVFSENFATAMHTKSAVPLVATRPEKTSNTIHTFHRSAN